MTFKCEYCSKSFKRESTLVSHMCRSKKRYLQRNEQHVKLGLKFFDDWYLQAMGSRKKKTYDDFVKSQYYGAFVRFGMYVLEARVLAPERYLTWLIKHQVKLDTWSKDSVYNKYLAEQSKRETAERALERFVIHAQTWSERTGHHWTEYWSTVNPNMMLYDIKMGKISPWIFLGYNKAKNRLDDLPTEMLIDVADTIDMAYWQRKLDVNKPTVDWIESLLK